MLDGDILRDHGIQSTLIQSSETPRTMFITVFNDVVVMWCFNDDVLLLET